MREDSCVHKSEGYTENGTGRSHRWSQSSEEWQHMTVLWCEILQRSRGTPMHDDPVRVPVTAWLTVRMLWHTAMNNMTTRAHPYWNMAAEPLGATVAPEAELLIRQWFKHPWECAWMLAKNNTHCMNVCMNEVCSKKCSIRLEKQRMGCFSASDGLHHI